MLQSLTASNGLGWVVWAYHCRFLHWFCVLLNDSGSRNTSCISTHLEHVCIAFLFLIDLHCQAADKWKQSSYHKPINTKNNKDRCIAMGLIIYSLNINKVLILWAGWYQTLTFCGPVVLVDQGLSFLIGFQWIVCRPSCHPRQKHRFYTAPADSKRPSSSNLLGESWTARTGKESNSELRLPLIY